jgi:hypothetical protein
MTFKEAKNKFLLVQYCELFTCKVMSKILSTFKLYNACSEVYVQVQPKAVYTVSSPPPSPLPRSTPCHNYVDGEIME